MMEDFITDNLKKISFALNENILLIKESREIWVADLEPVKTLQIQIVTIINIYVISDEKTDLIY